MFNHSQIMILFCSNPLRVNAKVITRPYKMWPLNTSLTNQVFFACPTPPHLAHPMHTVSTILALSSILTYRLHSHLKTLAFALPLPQMLLLGYPNICMVYSFTFFRSLQTMRPSLSILYYIEPTCPNSHPQYSLYHSIFSSIADIIRHTTYVLICSFFSSQ